MSLSIRSPLCLCTRNFRHELLTHVNTSIHLVKRTGLVHGLRPLTMKELHHHVWLTCAFIAFALFLAFTGLLFPVFSYGTVLIILFAAAS